MRKAVREANFYYELGLKLGESRPRKIPDWRVCEIAVTCNVDPAWAMSEALYYNAMERE